MSSIHISDLAFTQIEKFIDEHWERDSSQNEELAQVAVTLVIQNAQSFFDTFSKYAFIFEPVHEFCAIGILDTTKTLELQLRMVLQSEDMYIQAPDECPIDEMYYVRKAIAESHLPEYQPPDEHN